MIKISQDFDISFFAKPGLEVETFLYGEMMGEQHNGIWE